MRIAMPVNEKKAEGTINPSFGRAPYFLIYNTETKETVFVDNKAMESRGGAGIKAAQTLADNNVEALLVPRLGENAADALNAAEIKIYKTINDSIKDNIEAFAAGKLSLLEEIHEGFHAH
ncbi:MAG: dinitrogenase iron-molybdenum cofactor biosynthesis protein [Candidatus Riflebacteria bacterium]|nr:dinitrogenase iron-molybdenum cofactor biosynthesis protein [Candidatus Riflebacteria bacterium]